jgi:hypothetical protein
MKCKSLGRSGLQVSPLGLGMMNFGMVSDEATRFRIMDEALGGGINFIPHAADEEITSMGATWSKDELKRIAETDDLHVSPFREDGKTCGTPTWIWSVSVGDALYVRAYNGADSRWYQAALRQKGGRIIAAGMTKEVAFEPVSGSINDRIDAAYRSKYVGSPYLKSMIGTRARAATVEIVPRDKKV